MIYLTASTLIALIIEIIYRPRLDYTSNEELLLWYGGVNSRKWVKIF